MSLSEKMLLDAGQPDFRPRIEEMATMITEWTGSDAGAYHWYVAHPIASLANKTAEQLLREKDITLLLDFMHSTAQGPRCRNSL